MGRPVMGSAKRATVFGVTVLLILGGRRLRARQEQRRNDHRVCQPQGWRPVQSQEVRQARHEAQLECARTRRDKGINRRHRIARGAGGARQRRPPGAGWDDADLRQHGRRQPDPDDTRHRAGGHISAQCAIPTTGEVELIVLIKTSDGSLDWGYDFITDNGGMIKEDASEANAPAGMYTTPTTIDLRTAAALTSSDGQLEINQIGPSPGYMVWHELATTRGSQSCHLSVMAFPTSITSTSTEPGARAAAYTHGPIDLTDPRH
jgi:hypothetical protein